MECNIVVRKSYKSVPMLGEHGHKPLTGNINGLVQNFVVTQQRLIIYAGVTFHSVRQRRNSSGSNQRLKLVSYYISHGI